MSVKERLEANRDQIVHDYQNGASTVALGKMHDCSNAAVYLFLRQCGVQLRQVANKYDHLIPEALNLLGQGSSVANVAEYLGIPRSTLQRIASKNGHDTSHHLKRCETRLDSHTDEIISDHASGMSQSQIALRYQCDPSTISRILKSRAILPRFGYSCDHNFFAKIDSEEKAYALGFFTADGYNHRDGVMSIRIVDRDVLEKISRSMRYSGTIRTVPPPAAHPKRQVLYTLDIASQTMCGDLHRLGCPRKKTFTTRFPSSEEVPPDLLQHYIRGVFDGDGSLFHTTNGWHICIAGTADLLDPMRHFIHAHTDIMFGIYAQGKVYVMKVGGNRQVGTILEWLYRDATIYMDRKYASYCRFLDERAALSQENAPWPSD